MRTEQLYKITRKFLGEISQNQIPLRTYFRVREYLLSWQENS
jgi:hypothetical protein